MIIEVVGRPPEHLIETLKEIIEKIKQEPDVEIIESVINECCPLKEHNEFYANFAEIEIKTKEIRDLIRLMFNYMPAHIEVISPEKIHLSNQEWSETLSELILKLHGYDEVARVIEIEKNVLEKKFRTLLDEKEKGKSIISKEENSELNNNKKEKKPKKKIEK